MTGTAPGYVACEIVTMRVTGPDRDGSRIGFGEITAKHGRLAESILLETMRPAYSASRW